ncbi:TPA: VanZ family protein [Neisseria gonorrhoeae]
MPHAAANSCACPKSAKRGWTRRRHEAADTAPPPFPHFDKAAHLALFFAQILLLAKAFKTGKLPIPYRSLIAFAFCFAVGSECAQAWFTATRTGSLGDVLADLTGAALALFAARSACRPD